MNIKLTSIIILFQAFSIVGLCQEKITTEYFYDKTSKLNLNLKGKVKYVSEITDNLKRENNEEREFFFDKNGEPTKIIELSLGLDVMARELRNENTVFTFDNGKLVSELNQIDIGLDGNTYTYDDYGNKIHEKFYVQGRLVSEKIFEYDSKNRLTKFTDYVYGYFRDYNEERPDNKADFISMIKTYKYDNKGNLVEDSMNNIKGNVFKKHLYKYDTNGNMIEEGWCKSYEGLIDDTCDYNPSTGWEYNNSNQMIREYSIGKWSPHNRDSYYQYNILGNKIETKGFYIKEKDTVLGYLFKYEYNKFGNKTKDIEVVGKYRRLGFDRYKTEKIEYDEYQNITFQKFLTKEEEEEEEEEEEIKVVKYNYIYDDKGNWIEREKLEGKTSANLKLIEKKQRTIEYFE